MRHRKAKKQKHKNKSQQTRKNTSTRKFADSKFYKQIFLLIISISSIFIFFSIPVYKSWLQERIFKFYENFPAEFNAGKTEEELLKELHTSNYNFVNLME